MKLAEQVKSSQDKKKSEFMATEKFQNAITQTNAFIMEEAKKGKKMIKRIFDYVLFPKDYGLMAECYKDYYEKEGFNVKVKERYCAGYDVTIMW